MGEVAAITALDHPPNGTKRVRIWLDGEPVRTTNRRVVRALDLEVGMQVEAAALLAQVEREEHRQARDHALRYLAYRARSTGELSRRLTDVGYGPAAVTDTVAWLGASGYLDDEDFADRWVEERVRVKQFGRSRIVAELVQKGYSPVQVADALDRHCPEDTERERALAVARRRLAGAHGLERFAVIKRVAPYLRRKGYSPAVVASVIDMLLASEDQRDAEDLRQAAG